MLKAQRFGTVELESVGQTEKVVAQVKSEESDDGTEYVDGVDAYFNTGSALELTRLDIYRYDLKEAGKITGDDLKNYQKATITYSDHRPTSIGVSVPRVVSTTIRSRLIAKCQDLTAQQQAAISQRLGNVDLASVLDVCTHTLKITKISLGGRIEAEQFRPPVKDVFFYNGVTKSFEDTPE